MQRRPYRGQGNRNHRCKKTSKNCMQEKRISLLMCNMCNKILEFIMSMLTPLKVLKGKTRSLKSNLGTIYIARIYSSSFVLSFTFLYISSKKV